MKRTAFAQLCQISKAMVSKYEGMGLVVVDGDQVDAAASLAALEGRLDETKRRAALAMLEQMTGAPTAHSVREGAAAPTVPQRSAKAEKDEVELSMRRLEYGRLVKELVLATDVDAAAREAVAAFREILANTRRETADRLCAEYGINSQRAAGLAKFLARRDDLALDRYADAMSTLAGQDRAAPLADPELVTEAAVA